MSFQKIIRPILAVLILAIVVLIVLLYSKQISLKLFYVLLGTQMAYFLFNLSFIFRAIRTSKNQARRTRVMLSFMASYIFFSIAIFIGITQIFSLDGKTAAFAFIFSYILAKVAVLKSLNTVEKHY